METPQSTADRQARLSEIQRQIAAGDYETPRKIEAAVEILLDQFRRDKAPAQPR